MYQNVTKISQFAILNITLWFTTEESDLCSTATSLTRFGMPGVIHQSQATNTYVLVESCSFPKEFLLPGKSCQLLCSFLTHLNRVVLFHSHRRLYHLSEGILSTSSSESFRAAFALHFIMLVAMWCYWHTTSFLIERKTFHCVMILGASRTMLPSSI